MYGTYVRNYVLCTMYVSYVYMWYVCMYRKFMNVLLSVCSSSSSSSSMYVCSMYVV